MALGLRLRMTMSLLASSSLRAEWLPLTVIEGAVSATVCLTPEWMSSEIVSGLTVIAEGAIDIMDIE